MIWYEWGLLAFNLALLGSTVLLLRSVSRLQKDTDRNLDDFRKLRDVYNADTARLDYLIEHDAGLTRDSIDASMTWKGTGNDGTRPSDS